MARTSKPTPSGPAVFISHSSKDEDLARAVIELLRSALNLTSNDIRCTSVDGYRLPVGAHTESALREEVNAAQIVVGLVTPNSLSSPFVMFELGARWGAGSFVAPFLAGVTPDQVQAPLSYLNCLQARSEGQLYQFVEDVAKHLGRTIQNPSSYHEYIKALNQLAGTLPSRPKAEPAARRPKPNIVAKQAKVIFASADESGEALTELPLGKGPYQDSPMQAIVAEFRLEPRSDYGDDQAPVWYDVQASISYLDEAGHELLHVGNGMWLDHVTTTIKFPLLQNRNLVIARETESGEWIAPAPDNPDSLVLRIEDVAAAKIVLHDNKGVVLPAFTLPINLVIGDIGQFVQE